MTDRIDVVYTKNNYELWWSIGLGVVRKIEHYNDAFNRTGAVYIENDIKLWWPIGLGVDCDKNNIGQWRVDSINVVHAKHKTELSWLIKLDSIFDKKKTRQDNDMTDHIVLIYMDFELN